MSEQKRPMFSHGEADRLKAELKAEREKNAEMSAKIERLHDELCAFERVSSMDWLLDHLKGIFKKESSEDDR